MPAVEFIAGKHYRVLDVPHKNGYKYELLADVHVVLGHFDRSVRTQANIGLWVRLDYNYLFLSEGYLWNGPDVIRDWDSLMFPSLVHDAGYQLCAHGELPKDPWKRHFDNEFHRLSKRQGRPFVFRTLEWLAVSWFGGANGRYRPAHSL